MIDVKADSDTASEMSTREHPHLGVLLERGRRLLADALVARFQAEGYGDLRVAHGSVFAFLPPGGTRLTELARRARMTKQSMGELVRELETLGYVARHPDPADRRAKVVVFTARGERANALGIETIVETERVWAEQVGVDAIHGLRHTLQQITRAGP